MLKKPAAEADRPPEETDSSDPVALRIRSLRKDYQLASETVHVLKGIDLDVPHGDYVAIMGPSGSGKSTLLNVLGGLDPPTSGQYMIGDCDVADLSDDQLSRIRAERIGFVFQAYNLLPQLDVLENIEVPLAYHGGMTKDDRKRTDELAKLVGLDERVDHRPTELSAGNNGGRAVSQITLRLKDQEDAVATGKAVQQALERTHLYTDYDIGVPLKLLEQAENTQLMFMAMMGLLAGISLLVGGIGIMNIMLATVTERTREIGIRRALGARRRDITRQFLIETILLSVGGGITGILGGLTCRKALEFFRWGLGRGFPELMDSLPETVQSMAPIIIPWSIPIAFGISVTVGVVFGLYPAIRAASMNPIDALRHVG